MPYKISQTKFDEAMKLLNAPGDPFPLNPTKALCHQNICNLASSTKKHLLTMWQPLSHRRLLDEARICLQNQDWTNLTKILLFLSDDKIPKFMTLHSTMQYVFLLVLHDPVAKESNFLNTFLENCIHCKNDHEKTNFLEKILQISKKKQFKKILCTTKL